jgi:hypothetical protein
MKSQTAKQAREMNPLPAITNQREETASISKLSRQVRPSFHDLHARITTRADALYVARGY